MSKATEVFKLQRAVFGDDLCLIYNENRTVIILQQIETFTLLDY